MKQSVLFQFLLLTFLLTSCHPDWRDCEGPIGPEELYVFHSPDIQELYVDGSVDVRVYHSQNPRVEVVASRNIANRVEVIFHGPAVVIDQVGCIRNHNVLVEVYTPGLLRTEVSGSGDILFNDYNDVSHTILEINGSGDVSYMGDNLELTGIINGSGDIFLRGTARELDILIDGSGDVHAFDFLSESAYVEIDGSGDTEVWVERELTVKIHGSGDVFFIGRPDLYITDRGSGDVIDYN
ncbi:MAG: head GIN domain-containing protein [Saprospiraceae bacterium]|nr:head GIN domain-containing protein [Saprospiraceae bacterium]